MNGIKTDPDVKMEGGITPSGSGYMDDDFYEDTGELSLPGKSDKDVWLTRIPKWMYEAVCKYDDLADGRDDDQIVLGEVLAIPDKKRAGHVDPNEPIRLFFNNPMLNRKNMPQAFELNMTNASQDVLGNTYVFTEKDLPGFKPSTSFRGRPAPNASQAVQDPGARIQKRSKYKKAIPKQTSLVGPTTREYIAKPLPTPEFLVFNRSLIRTAITGRSEHVNLIFDVNESNLLEHGQRKAFGSFKTAKQPARTQLNKAARIPRNELIDMIHAAFDKYMYWSMKALKAHTKQPEAYIKEVLQDGIADLVKAGPFASTWRRRPEFEKLDSAQHAVAAAADVPEGAEDEEDEDEEMENVI